jgi:hypothetical protein
MAQNNRVGVVTPGDCKVEIKTRNIPKNLLWHYTDFDGLYGMLKNDVVRASNIAYMNDAQEFKHTLDIGIDLIAKSCKKFPLFNLESVRDFVRRVMYSLPVYVSSFSRDDDDLGQWRAYAHVAPAFSIGFSREELARLSPDLSLLDCEYKLGKQRAEVAALVKPVFAGAETRRRLLEDSSDAVHYFYNGLLQNLAENLARIAPKNKPKAFDAEHEVRIVTRVGTVDFRKSRSLIVPFVEWKMRAEKHKGESPIKCIIVGPGPLQSEVIAVTEQMCRQYSVQLHVYESLVPYRNW